MTAAAAGPRTVADTFARDTANHQMTVLHDDGVYRHLFFRGTEGSAYWFELITWPGALTIRGDMGTYTFARIHDMFQFFRGDTDINPHYWGEKLPGGRASVKKYNADYARRQITDLIDEFEKYGDDPDAVSKARDEVTLTTGLDDIWDGEQRARELLEKLEQIGIVSDVWEFELRDYEWSFLWCCHAIVWGIGRYDAARSAVA